MEKVTLLNFVILSLVVYRVSSLLVYEEGPFEVFKKLRDFVGVVINEDGIQEGTTELSKALICPFCNSIWLGLIVTIIFILWPNYSLIMTLPLALSAITCILTEVLDG